MTLRTPYIKKTKGQFYTLPELCEMRFDQSFVYLGNAFMELWCYPEQREPLAAYLAQLGFKRFSYQGNGAHSIVLNTVDNQVLRISLDEWERPRLEHPAILQPLHSSLCEAGGQTYRIELFPKVTVDDLSIPEIQHLASALYTTGVQPNDIGTYGNVGRLPCGKAVVLDIGEFTLRDNAPLNPQHPCLVKGGWVDEHGDWAQYKDFPQLKKRMLTGVLTQAELDALEAKRGAESCIVAGYKKGFYAPEVGQLLIDAANDTPRSIWPWRKEPAGFAERFEKECARKRASRKGANDDEPRVR